MRPGLSGDQLSALHGRLRANAHYAPRQLAYLGILHGLSLGTFVRVPEGQAPDCSEARLKTLREMAEVE